MKTIIALAVLLLSANLFAADIYEFKQEWPAKPAPAKTVPKPVAQTHTTQPVEQVPAAEPTSQPTTPAAAPTPDDAVVHVNDCSQSALCNDL